MYKKQGGFISLAIIFIVATTFVGGIAYIFTNKTAKIDVATSAKTDTNSEYNKDAWVLYTDENYGFQIEYPVGTEIRNLDLQGVYVAFDPTQTKGSLSVQAVKQNNFEKNFIISCKNYDSRFTVSESILDGKIFQKLDTSVQVTGVRASITEYCLVHDDIKYQIIVQNTPLDRSQYVNVNEDPTFNRMLRSFKILPKPSATFKKESTISSITTGSTTVTTKHIEQKSPEFSYDAIIQNTVNCGTEACFEEKFAVCEPATLTSVIDMDIGAVEYTIIGKGAVGCNLTFKYTAYPEPSWINKEMTCEFDNKVSFEDSINKVFRGVGEGTVTCKGPLYEILRPQ